MAHAEAARRISIAQRERLQAPEAREGSKEPGSHFFAERRMPGVNFNRFENYSSPAPGVLQRNICGQTIQSWPLKVPRHGSNRALTLAQRFQKPPRQWLPSPCPAGPGRVIQEIGLATDLPRASEPGLFGRC